MLHSAHQAGRHRNNNTIHAQRSPVQRLATSPFDAAVLQTTQPRASHREREEALQHLRHELCPRPPRKNLRTRRRATAHSRLGTDFYGYQVQPDRQPVADAAKPPQDILRLRPKNSGHHQRRRRRPSEIQHDLQHRCHLRLRQQEHQAGLRRQRRRHCQEHRSRQRIYDHRVVADTRLYSPVWHQDQAAIRAADSHSPCLAAKLGEQERQHPWRQPGHILHHQRRRIRPKPPLLSRALLPRQLRHLGIEATFCVFGRQHHSHRSMGHQ